MRFAEKFLTNWKSTVIQDITLCFAVTLTCSFYEYEDFIPQIAAIAIRKISIVLLVVCWFWCSFLNGYRKKYSFLVFTAAFWIIPRIVIIAEEHTGILKYNKYLDAFSVCSRLMADTPLSGLGELLKSNSLYLSIALLTWCLCMFYAGKLVEKSR